MCAQCKGLCGHIWLILALPGYAPDGLRSVRGTLPHRASTWDDQGVIAVPGKEGPRDADRVQWKTNTSAVENCPALYKAPGGYVVQGKALDAETKAQLRQFGAGEDAVFVPADVIDRIEGL